MHTICKRAELELKKLIHCENFIKNKKVKKFYPGKEIKLWLFNKKDLGIIFDFAFTIYKGNPLAYKKGESDQIIKKIQNFTIYEMFKKSCEYFLSIPNKHDITELVFSNEWNKWFEKNKLNYLKVSSGLQYSEYSIVEKGKQQFHKKYSKNSFLIWTKMDIDVINELYCSGYLIPFDTDNLINDNGIYSIDSINYSHIFVGKQELGDAETEIKFLTISPEAVSYFNDKRRNNRLPWVASILSIISITASIIVPIIYHYVK